LLISSRTAAATIGAGGNDDALKKAALLGAAADQRLRESYSSNPCSGFIGGSGCREPRCPTRAITLNPQRYFAWSDAMDDHGQLEYATARGNDYLGHEQMYRTFVTLMTSAVAVIAVILILMVIFLT
jgi:hypothetical protein